MATKKLVPRATNEGGLGTALKVWGGSWLQNLVITNLQTSVSGSVLVETAGNVEKRAATSFLPNLESLDEGGSLTTTTESIDYVGAGVTTTVSGNDTTVTITGAAPVADTNDSTSYVGLWESATGILLPKTDGELRYDATNDILKIGKTGNDLWIRSGSITQYINNLRVKVKGGIKITSTYGKTTMYGGFQPLISFYSIYGTWVHLLQTEPAPVNIITEAVPGGATTVGNGINGVLCRTPITTLVPNLQSLDEGSSLTTTTQSINYVGDGVTTTVGASNDTTVTIPGAPTVLDTENPACFLGMYEAATGALSPKTDESLTYDALNEILKLDGYMELGAVGSSVLKIIRRAATTNVTGGNLSIHAGGTTLGTDINGGDLQLASGIGTGLGGGGSGQGSSVNIWTSEPTAASSAANQTTQYHTRFRSSSAVNETTHFSGTGITSYLQTLVYGNGATQIATYDATGTDTAHYKVYAKGNIFHNSSTGLYDWTGAANAFLGTLSGSGLRVFNIPSEPAPTHIIVDNATTPGLFSKIALSALATQLIAVQDTELAGCFVGLWEAANGNLEPKTDEGLTYNALTGSELLTLIGDMRITGTGTTSNILDITNNTLTTGIALNIEVDGEKAGTANNPLVNFDIVETVPDTVTNGMSLLRVNYRKTGATGSATTSKKYGQRISVWDAASNNVGASMEQTGLYISSGFNSNVGSIKQTGIYLGVGSSNVGDSGLSTVGIDLNVLDAGYDIKMSSNTTSGWATMRTVADGAFELTTTDPLSNNADITFDADGETNFKKTTVLQATVESLRTESFMMACSDETTALTAGTNKVKFRMPYAFTVTGVRASLSTAGTGSQLVTVDINESGTSILSTEITIDATETTSVTAATAPVISDTSLADDAEITVDIDFIDTGGVSAGLKVAIIGHKTV